MATSTNKIRRMILDMTLKSGHGHLGGSLSCVEILWAIFEKMTEDDVFILSKGHAAQTLYAILAIRGMIPEKELSTFCQRNSCLLGHPVVGLPSVVINTGSLGNGLGVGAGIALAKKIKGEKGKVFIVMSDGELYEGSTWEAIHFAPEVPLNNLVCVIDYNNQTVLKEINDPYIRTKFSAFYWDTEVIDGHNSKEIELACLKKTTYPLVIIAKTLKGKGISFIENKIGYHQGLKDKEEAHRARLELGQS